MVNGGRSVAFVDPAASSSGTIIGAVGHAVPLLSGLVCTCVAVFQRSRIQEILMVTGSYRIRSRSFYRIQELLIITFIRSSC